MVEVMHENCSLKLYNIIEFQDVQSDNDSDGSAIWNAMFASFIPNNIFSFSEDRGSDKTHNARIIWSFTLKFWDQPTTVSKKCETILTFSNTGAI